MTDLGSINKVILVGRIATEITFKEYAQGKARASFSLATNEVPYQSKRSRVTFTRIVCYGQTARLLRDYGDKGRLIAVDGKIVNRHWEKAPGQKAWITEIVAISITMLTAKNKEEPNTMREPGEDEDDPFAQE